MKETVKEVLDTLLSRYPMLDVCKEDIQKSFEILKTTFQNGGKLLVCGNGGSASDSAHIIGELVKSFNFRRKISTELEKSLTLAGEDGLYLALHLEGGLPAIALPDNFSGATAYANDNVADAVFAQEVNALGNATDTLLSLSTSGNSRNCVLATITAKAKGMATLALTGAKDSKLSNLCDCTIKVPETATFKIQEYHLPVYHALCAMLECEFFAIN